MGAPAWLPKESPEMLKHNKKRNVGLINEFFARYMARAIIERRDSDLKKAKELFSKHFQKGTDLHRELRLFSSLYETRLQSREAAASLIEQAKQVCKLQSQARIDLEKTALLHEINQQLGEPKFFDQEVAGYRDYATIQVLLNHWRGSILTENLSEAAQLEDRFIQHLTRASPSIEKEAILQMSETEVDGLVVNLMTEKLNKKFSSSLNTEQKKLLQLYVFSKDSPESKVALVEKLEGLRKRASSSIENALSRDEQAKKVGNKLKEIQGMLQEDYRDTSNPDDKLVTFYMTVSKLEEELNNNE